MIVLTTCIVIVIAAVYFMLYGLIHDGPFGSSVVDYFKYLIGILTGGATISTLANQFINYKLKGKGEEVASEKKEVSSNG